MEIVPGNPSVWGLNRRGVAKYSDFGPFQGYREPRFRIQYGNFGGKQLV